jgi:hypothetical protein
MVEIEIDPVEIRERKADDRGRVNLGTDRAGETLRVAVVEVVESE